MTQRRVAHMNRLAAVQMASGPRVHANLLAAGRLIAEAARGGARLVVLPENFAHMGREEHDKLALAEQPGDGPIQDFLAREAARLGIWIVGGTLPLAGRDAGRVRASCLVYDERGRQVARYDKMHLFDVEVVGSEERYMESDTVEPGDELAVVDTPVGRLGLAVCYDLRFPELFRCLQARGAEIIVLPSAFTAVTGQAHWEPLLRARAIENLCYIVAAAQGGSHASGRQTHGDSMIVDRWGLI